MIFTGLYTNYCVKTVPFSLRLVLTVQKEVDGVKTGKEQWREIVEDLWDKQLFHLRKDVYSDVCDPCTGRYGFRMSSEREVENSLMYDLLNEPSSRKEEEYSRKEEREDAECTQNRGKCISDCCLDCL